MNWLQALFKLLMHFGLIDEREFPSIKKEGEDWYNAIPYEYTEDCGYNKLTCGMKKYSQMWWVKIIVSLVYLWCIKNIQDLFNPDLSKEDDREEDDDDRPLL